MSARRSTWTAIVTAAALVFLFAPLAIVVLFSFHVTSSLTPPFEGLSTRWYSEVLSDRAFRSGLATSLRVGLLTAAATLVAGTAAAYGVSRTQSRLKSVYGVLFVLPVALPALILGIALLSFFSSRGIPLSTTTVVIAHTVFVTPVFFVIARTALDRVEVAQLEAAADLGATPWCRFRLVILPQVLPVLLAGAAMAFVISFDEFIVTFFVIGNDSTLPLVIFSRLRRTIDPSINAISSLMLFANLAVWLGAVLYAVRLERRRRHSLARQDRGTAL
ncbi:MAG: ABC transporter permease [Acidimicrobiaceae bacterium]|nr:ABC transporter permease [Acidimicrobiaceae bacterium]